jgi:hypothetical protein
MAEMPDHRIATGEVEVMLAMPGAASRLERRHVTKRTARLGLRQFQWRQVRPQCVQADRRRRGPAQRPEL